MVGDWVHPCGIVPKSGYLKIQANAQDGYVTEMPDFSFKLTQFAKNPNKSFHVLVRFVFGRYEGKHLFPKCTQYNKIQESSWSTKKAARGSNLFSNTLSKHTVNFPACLNYKHTAHVPAHPPVHLIMEYDFAFVHFHD